MTRKEYWLKVFSENDAALASALILIEKFATQEHIDADKEYIESRVGELYEEIPLTVVKGTFPNYKEEESG